MPTLLEQEFHESLGYQTPCEIYFGQQYKDKEKQGQAFPLHLKQACFLS